MERLTDARRPRPRAGVQVVAGAAVGLMSGAMGIWLGAGIVAGMLSILVIVAVGLVLGWLAAVAAYFASVIGAIVGFGLAGGGPVLTADIVRLGLAILVGPILILLIRHEEQSYEAARRARDALVVLGREGELREEELQATQEALTAAYSRAEQERARLTEVAEAIPEPLIVYGTDGRGRYGNRAALRLFGRAFIELPPADWRRLADPRDEQGTPLLEADLPQLRAQTGSLRRRILVRLPTSGRDLLIDVEGTPVMGGGCVVLMRDVGKEEDARRRLSRFASFVAHELRNPLAVAKARVELAQRDPDVSRRARSHGVRALDSIEAAIAILERLELYSRADTGRVEAVRERFDLRVAVDTAIERLRARGSERTVHLDMPPVTHVIGDRQLAEGAITNLLTNADRYSAPTGAIHIETVLGDPVVLRVRDDGPGIADDVAGTLFRERVTGGRGLGLGLFQVRATMDAQGGSVELEQRRPQAVFALRFPAAPAMATTTEGAASPT